jgi:hypothetical protein
MDQLENEQIYKNIIYIIKNIRIYWRLAHLYKKTISIQVSQLLLWL